MIVPITEKVILQAGCISFRIKLKTQVKMNYNILSPSLGVTISLVLSSSILAVNRNDEVLFGDHMELIGESDKTGGGRL